MSLFFRGRASPGAQGHEWTDEVEHTPPFVPLSAFSLSLSPLFCLLSFHLTEVVVVDDSRVSSPGRYDASFDLGHRRGRARRHPKETQGLGRSEVVAGVRGTWSFGSRPGTHVPRVCGPHPHPSSLPLCRGTGGEGGVFPAETRSDGLQRPRT